MARGRMISKSLSTSEKRARLHELLGPLAEFAQGLFPLLVVHADDFGRLQGSPFSIKNVVDPSSPRTLGEFSSALAAMAEVGLLVWYEVDSRKYVQIIDFEPHQPGLHKRTRSRFPEPSGYFPEIPLKRRERKRTEQKRTERKRTARRPPRPRRLFAWDAGTIQGS